MESNVDLRQLAVDRNPPRSPPRERRRLWSRVVLPAALLAGFAALVAYAAWDVAFPPRRVTVVSPVLLQAGGGFAADAPLFRAAGWVEPRPTATVVSALTDGVIDKLSVVEGQEVRAGEIVATLVPTDAHIELDAADADVTLRESEVAAAKVALTAAAARRNRPLHLESEVAEAAAATAKAESELAKLPHLLRAAKARRQFAKRDFDDKSTASGAIAEAAIVKARRDWEEADAAFDELLGREKPLTAELTALRRKHAALTAKLDSRIDEIANAEEAATAVRAAEARLRQAQSRKAAARLRCERLEVKTPVAGRVLSVVARPGATLTAREANVVATVYDPKSLQLRVDVRLDDVDKVTTGQKVQIESAALGGKSATGRVLASASQADVQKNTLAIKVAIADPPATLAPEMLCQATFLAAPRTEDVATKTESIPFRLYVPKSLTRDGRLWVADGLAGVARRKTVELGPELGELVEVTAGLAATDRLIVDGRDGLEDGTRIAIRGEDESLGVGSRKEAR